MKDAFIHCMEALDVAATRRMWPRVFPHLPAPGGDDDILTMLHMARTQSKAVAFKLRAYSHRWLTERNLPSQLPDDLKPSAERMYPRVASAVGISVGFRDPDLKPAGELIRKAMEGAVSEAEADGKLEDSAHVKARMSEAREKERKALFGRWGP